MKTKLSYPKQLVRLILLIVITVSCTVASQVRAGDITVTSTDDRLDKSSPDCILRDAIDAANTDQPVGSCRAGSGKDVISFDLRASSPPWTVALLAELPKIYRDLVIAGPRADTLVIDGGVRVS